MEINTILSILKDKKSDKQRELNPKIEVTYQDEKISNFTNNISSQLRKEKDIRKQNYDIEIDSHQTDQKIHSDLNYLNCCLNLDLLTCPITVNDNLLYCLICASFPIFASFEYDVQMCKIKKLKQKLAYDLDEKMYYDRFNYKRVFKKTDIQNKLLNNEIIIGPIIRDYFSDYFNVNIFIINNDLIVESSNSDNDNPNIFLLSQYPNLSVITIDNGRGLFNKIEAGHILENFKVKLNKVLPITKYKIDEIKNLAESLKISITCVIDEKQKRKKKLDIYIEICDKLSNY